MYEYMYMYSNAIQYDSNPVIISVIKPYISLYVLLSDLNEAMKNMFIKFPRYSPLKHACSAVSYNKTDIKVSC